MMNERQRTEQAARRLDSFIGTTLGTAATAAPEQVPAAKAPDQAAGRFNQVHAEIAVDARVEVDAAGQRREEFFLANEEYVPAVKYGAWSCFSGVTWTPGQIPRMLKQLMGWRKSILDIPFAADSPEESETWLRTVPAAEVRVTFSQAARSVIERHRPGWLAQFEAELLALPEAARPHPNEELCRRWEEATEAEKKAGQEIRRLERVIEAATAPEGTLADLNAAAAELRKWRAALKQAEAVFPELRAKLPRPGMPEAGPEGWAPKQAGHNTPAPVKEGPAPPAGESPAAPAGEFVPAAEIVAAGDRQPRVLTLYTHLGARRVPAANIRSVFPGGVPGDIYTYCVEVRPGIERMGNGEFHAHSVYGIRQSTAKWLCGELGIVFVPGEETVVRPDGSAKSREPPKAYKPAGSTIGHGEERGR